MKMRSTGEGDDPTPVTFARQVPRAFFDRINKINRIFCVILFRSSEYF
jgi:hypothetical protein